MAGLFSFGPDRLSEAGGGRPEREDQQDRNHCVRKAMPEMQATPGKELKETIHGLNQTPKAGAAITTWVRRERCRNFRTGEQMPATLPDSIHLATIVTGTL